MRWLHGWSGRGVSFAFSILLLTTCLLWVVPSSNAFFPWFALGRCSIEFCKSFWIWSGCSPDADWGCLLSQFFDIYSSYTSGPAPIIEREVSTQAQLQGAQVTLRLWAQPDGESEARPPAVDLVWTPPSHATEVRFLDRQPDAQRGTSFHFHRLAMDYAGAVPGSAKVRVSYALPTDDEAAVDTLQVVFRDERGARSGRSASLPVRLDRALARAGEGTAAEANAVATDQVAVNLWYYQPGSPRLSSEICNAIADQRGMGTPFLALRFPVLQEPYELPVLEQEGESPVLEILDERSYPFKTIMSTTLVYLPEYHDWLYTYLPADEDERFAALGLDPTDTITCPTGLDIPASSTEVDWETHAKAVLNLQTEPGACFNGEVAVFYCYSGPGVLSESVGSGMVSAEGVTCVGPHIFSAPSCKSPSPPLQFHTSGGVTAAPGEEVLLNGALENVSSAPVSVDLSVEAGPGDGWALYKADYDGPLTPRQLLPNPAHIAGHDTLDYCLIGRLPEGALGASTCVITATQRGGSGESVRSSSLVVVSDWDAYPQFLNLLLPLVLRPVP